MSALRRAVVAYGHCLRYSDTETRFRVDIIAHDPIRTTWIASARIGGKFWARHAYLAIAKGYWYGPDGPIGPTRGLTCTDDLIEAFTRWLEHVEDELGDYACRTLLKGVERRPES